MTSKRLTRKEIVQEDRIRTSLTQIYEWIVRNRYLLTASVSLLLLTALGSYFWKNYQQNRSAELQIKFAEALKIYHSTNEKNPNGEQSINPKRYHFETDTERRKKALTTFNTVITSSPESSLGLFSRYYSARIQYELDQQEEAKQKLTSIIKDTNQIEIRSLARNFLAHVLLLEKKRKQASEILKAILNDNDSSFPKESVIVRLARNLEQDNNVNEAVKFYKKLLTDHPDSNYANEARSRIDQLEFKESE